MDFQTILAPVAIAAVTALALGIYRHFEDRIPLFNRILSVIGTAIFVFFAVWAAVEAPGFLLAAIGAFLALNLLYGMASTSSRLEATPVPPRVWVEPMADIRGSGWVHLGSWALEVGDKRPELTIYERPRDGARVTAIGTAAAGGIVEVQSLFDEGRGYLASLNKRSHTVRPTWMFKQALDGEPLADLIRAHDEASEYLRVMGAAPSRFPQGDPLDAIREEHRMMRRFFTRRWWLIAIRPLMVRLSPSRSRRLHEQSDIERQLDRYREWLSRAPKGPASTAS